MCVQLPQASILLGGGVGVGGRPGSAGGTPTISAMAALGGREGEGGGSGRESTPSLPLAVVMTAGNDALQYDGSLCVTCYLWRLASN